MRYLKNLVSTEAIRGHPWDFIPGDIPEVVRRNKRVRDEWINHPTTTHCVYSGWEGFNPVVRVSTSRSDLDNPPTRCDAIVADYDVILSVEEIQQAINRTRPELVPQYIGFSLSGKVHAVWLFEKPALVAGTAHATLFAESFATLFRLGDFLPGLDPKCLLPTMYFTSGCAWNEVNPEPIKEATILGLVVSSAKKVDWSRMGKVYQLDRVRTALMQNPAFVSSWANIPFELEAKGPTWFVEGSTSPKSAIIKDSGVYTFSQHAAKPFWTWSELLGENLAESISNEQVGEAVRGIWYDGDRFWRKLPDDRWAGFNLDMISRYLRTSRGLSGRKEPKDPASELDQAVQFIVDHQSIEGAAAFAFRPSGIVRNSDGRIFLNTHTRKVLPPAHELTPWGPDGKFPWVSGLLGDLESDENMFCKQDALLTFVSWLALFYRTCHERKLSSGHNIFLCGATNAGKTFTNLRIIGSLVGGSANAERYLMGEDGFGSELFETAHWAVDDGTIGTSPQKHRIWGEMIKRMAANREFKYHAKFRTPMQVTWQGRVVCTMNADEESIRMIPELGLSLLDKIMLFKVRDEPLVAFGTADENEQVLARELPYFARWLLEWKTPEHLVQRRPNGTVDHRFGAVKPWHDPFMVRSANQSSRLTAFVEVIQDWKTKYLEHATNEKGTPPSEWAGTAFQLRRSLIELGGSAAHDTLRALDHGDVGKLLAALKNKGYQIEATSEEGELRKWTIRLN